MNNQKIRFIDSRYNDLFYLEDGGKIHIIQKDGDIFVQKCSCVGSHHVRVGTNTYHICQFAEIMESIGSMYFPCKPGQEDIALLSIKQGYVEKILKIVEDCLHDGDDKEIEIGGFTVGETANLYVPVEFDVDDAFRLNVNTFENDNYINLYVVYNKNLDVFSLMVVYWLVNGNNETFEVELTPSQNKKLQEGMEKYKPIFLESLLEVI